MLLPVPKALSKPREYWKWARQTVTGHKCYLKDTGNLVNWCYPEETILFCVHTESAISWNSGHTKIEIANDVFAYVV
jgi:hypothetical protein